MAHQNVKDKETYAQVLKRTSKLENRTIQDQMEKNLSRNPTFLNIREDQIPDSLKQLNHDSLRNKLLFVRQIGCGGYGKIFLAFDKESKEKIAVKQAIESDSIEMLFRETCILQKLQNTVGIPKFYEFVENSYTAFYTMDLLGKSLYDLICMHGKMPLSNVADIGIQMLNILNSIHSHGILHRDLSPCNILTKRNFSTKEIFLVDFGLATKICVSELKASPVGKSQLGASNFTSLRSDKGIEQCYRDDYESLGYVLIYLAIGKFPWDMSLVELQGSSYYKFAKELKQLNHILRNVHGLFINYFEYVRNLRFGQRPNIDYLSSLLEKIKNRVSSTHAS